LADFGLSRRAEVSNSTKNIFEALPYIDPQYYKNKTNNNRPNKKSDVYSVGVLLWEISSGQKPFGSYDAPLLLFDIINGKREVPISGTPVDYVNIYTSMDLISYY
jgi:serine/threonine protein kinase